MEKQKTVHIVTVGTSIIRNLAHNASRYSIPEELAKKYEKWSQATVRSAEDAEAGSRASRGCAEFEKALEILSGDPYRLSAELNAMRIYLKEGEVDAVVLLASDSGASEFSAKVLGAYLEAEGKKVETRRVGDLGVDFQGGLLNLIDEVAMVLDRYRREGYRVWINLTGGFKLEAAVLYLVSCLSGIGVEKAYYIHEAMKETVEVPVIPVNLDKAFLGIVEKLGEEEIELDEAYKRIGAELLDVLLRSGLAERVGSKVRIRAWVLHLVRGSPLGRRV